MIAMMVSFQLPPEMSRAQVMEEARIKAEQCWSKEVDLVRKDFLLDENNVTYGFYVFRNKDSAERTHGEAFLKRVREEFNVEPHVQYFDLLMTADNSLGEVIEYEKS